MSENSPFDVKDFMNRFDTVVSVSRLHSGEIDPASSSEVADLCKAFPSSEDDIRVLGNNLTKACASIQLVKSCIANYLRDKLEKHEREIRIYVHMDRTARALRHTRRNHADDAERIAALEKILEGFRAELDLFGGYRPTV
jgi:hypothetical protein